MSEAELEEHVRGACKDLGVRYVHHRNSTGTEKGFPDDVLIGTHGVLWRELKDMRRRVTPEQHAMGEALTVAGQDFGVWRPDDWLSGRIARELTAISKLRRAA